jgi:hypothetical protein
MVFASGFTGVLGELFLRRSTWGNSLADNCLDMRERGREYLRIFSCAASSLAKVFSRGQSSIDLVAELSLVDADARVGDGWTDLVAGLSPARHWNPQNQNSIPRWARMPLE